MLIVDTYSRLRASFSPHDAHPVFRDWGYTREEIAQWFQDLTTASMRETAERYLEQTSAIVDQVEHFFGNCLKGELVLIPSMGEIDGFARFDRGRHTVMLGIDFPGASLDYLRALTAHELSHVYRDHSPEVWGFLGKPLSEVSRQEYLDAISGREHLISEGLATLTSQAVFPDVAMHDHHYYEPQEMQWCLANEHRINHALGTCLLSSDPDPWRFYSEGVVAEGSPSRTHYYWAAQKIDAWIKRTPGMTLLLAHGLPADRILAF